MRKYGLLVIVFTLLTVLFGCGTDKGEIYDSDLEIAKEGDSYTFVGRIGNQRKNQVDFRFKKFSGMQSQWLIEAKENSEIKLRYDTEIEKGDFKIVLVTPKQEVTNIAQNTSKGNYKVKTSKGKYRIKIVGRNAKGKIKMDLETKGVKRVSHQEDN
ncbi:hypothetical protein [Bacillus marasmi]|uniref:hypothetical protein n=1 Tax=Bacillus marasmi TaxID=1926279 RepID=UPI0011C93F54|nr:hypothetical protein [Bacillus marasmi]